MEAKKPHYNHKNWIHDRVKNLAYLQNIASYPEKYIEKRKEYEKMIPKKPEQDKEKLVALRARFLDENKKKTKKLTPHAKIPAIQPSDQKMPMESSL